MIQSPMDGFECIHCGEELFNEENIIELCNEPFNGIVATCSNCGAEFSLDMYIKVSQINGPTNENYTDEEEEED